MVEGTGQVLGGSSQVSQAEELKVFLGKQVVQVFKNKSRTSPITRGREHCTVTGRQLLTYLHTWTPMELPTVLTRGWGAAQLG